MKKTAISISAIFVSVWAVSYAQIVTFNSPSPWVSLRETAVVAKTLLDTAKVEKKSVQFTLYKIENKKKAKLGGYTLKAKDYSEEFQLASLKTSVFGGRNYLKIEWSVQGTKDKGSLEPFGILVVDSGKVDTVAVGKWIQGALDAAAAKTTLADKDFVAVGKKRFGVIWNEKMLGLVCRKDGVSGALTFTFDGKNGKNAFLAYPDRFVSYLPESDSVHAWHYKRSVSDTGIVYKEGEWIHEITKTVDGDIVLISVPWYDLGIIPFDGRIVGFAVFEGSSASVPSGARQEIPGTWGDLVLLGGGKKPPN